MPRTPARMWETTSQGGAVCLLCRRKCAIGEGSRGFCQVRVNVGGSLYSLNYGYAGAINLDPVEKKPLYHYRPGTLTFSVGAPGCNLDCQGCQNHSLSRPGEGYAGDFRETEPAALVALARRTDARSLSFTYSEPTVFFEYAEDTGRLAWERGLPSIWVTNGFFSSETLETLDYVSAMNIDLKGFTESFYQEVAGARLKPVLEAVEAVFRKGIWVEVTTLIIPGLNDQDDTLSALASFIAGLSPDVPWHLSRFMPLHRQSHLSVTPEETLLRARDIGREAGLKYVYLGNLRGPSFADTVCPGCGDTLVKRDGFTVSENHIQGDGKCPGCGERIAGVW